MIYRGFKLTQVGDVYFPLLSIAVVNTNPRPRKSMLERGFIAGARGLVDTGASFCVFPSGWAEILGHDLKGGLEKRCPNDKYYKQTCETAKGAITLSEFSWHFNEIRVVNPLDTNKMIYGFKNVRTAFSEDVKQPILGVRQILEQFKIEIDYPRKEFSLSTE